MLRHQDGATLADELSTCRRAADLVSDMVSVEEGRMRSTTVAREPGRPPALDLLQPPATTPDLAPLSPNAAFSAYGPEGEALPAYESASESSSVVTDGFRYTPGSTEYSPSVAGSGADDVLGDTKQ
jgi:hypothetical protein